MQDNSILMSTKKMLGIEPSQTHFDPDLIIHINSVFMILNQMGVGPKEAYSISGPEDTWDEFEVSSEKYESVKSYMYLKVRSIFDPPTGSQVSTALNSAISELEWRLNFQRECEKE